MADKKTREAVTEPFFARVVKDGIARVPPKKFKTTSGDVVERWRLLTSSEASKCIRRLAYQKIDEAQKVQDVGLNGDPDPYHTPPLHPSAGIFERGNWVEKAITSAFRLGLNQSEYVALMDEDQVTLIDEENRMGGTPDGLFYLEDYHMLYMIELKSTGAPLPTPESGPKSGHMEQALCNAYMLHRTVEKHGAEKAAKLLGIDGWLKFDMEGNAVFPTIEGAVVLYVNGMDFCDMSEFTYQFFPDDELFADMKVKAARLRVAVTNKNPMYVEAEGSRKGECRWCPYVGDCNPLGFGAPAGGSPLSKAPAKLKKETPTLDFFVRRAIESGVTSDIDADEIARRVAMVTKASESAKAYTVVADLNKEQLMNKIGDVMRQVLGDDAEFVVDYGDGNIISVRLMQVEHTSLDKENLRIALISHGLTLSDFEVKKEGKPYFRFTERKE